MSAWTGRLASARMHCLTWWPPAVWMIPCTGRLTGAGRDADRSGRVADVSTDNGADLRVAGMRAGSGDGWWMSDRLEWATDVRAGIGAGLSVADRLGWAIDVRAGTGAGRSMVDRSGWVADVVAGDGASRLVDPWSAAADGRFGGGVGRSVGGWPVPRRRRALAAVGLRRLARSRMTCAVSDRPIEVRVVGGWPLLRRRGALAAVESRRLAGSRMTCPGSDQATEVRAAVGADGPADGPRAGPLTVARMDPSVCGLMSAWTAQ